jgi:hypothetical protein
MPYYLITKTQYDTEHASNLDHGPAWNLDRTKCVIHAPDSYIVDNPEQIWNTSNECNEWRYSESEKTNWMTDEDINGW